MTQKTIQIKIKSCAPYAKGWQVNAIIDGEESEMTFYGESKSFALEQAKKRIEKEGRLPHAPYKGEK
jgi:hypothetical protein